jgi:DNA-binding MurR/RpiR family transcriptional regulator
MKVYFHHWMETATADAAILNTRIGRRIAGAYQDFSRSQRRAADFVVDKPFDAATMSIEEFAAAADISPASANRFARSLGFARYADFRSQIVEAIRPPRIQEDKLRALSRKMSAATVAARSLDEDMANLRNAAAALSADQVEAAAGMLREARRIFTVGFGTSSYLASYAANLLDPLCADARFVAVEGGTEQSARRLIKLRAGDAVLAITLPRYSRDIVTMVRLARARGAQVLAITDRPSSPIAALASLTLFAFAERQILSSSGVATLALIEALASAVAHGRKGAIAAMKALTRQVEPYLDEAGAAPETKSTSRRSGRM